MWWLAAFFFENICLLDGYGKRKIIPNTTGTFLHILAGFMQNLVIPLKFLVGNFSKRGEVIEQFGAYQEIALNKGIIDAANLMYWDDNTEGLRRGAAGKGSGSARRLVRIIRQYQMTYDLNSMNGNEIVELLPGEFNKWATS